MRHARILAAFGLLGAAAAADAEVTSAWTLASDYDLRGITQSAQDPAVQGSIDYAAASGWYIGAWGSNIDFGDELDTDLEVDVYTGFSGGSSAGLGYNVGIIHYSYVGERDLDYMEIYAGLSKDWFKAKASYSNDFGGDSTAGKTPSFYVETSAVFPLPQNLSVLAHAGYSFGDYWDRSNNEYFDYSLGVGYTAGKFDLALKWIDGSDLKVADGTPGNVLSSEARMVFSFTTTFPWQQE